MALQISLYLASRLLFFQVNALNHRASFSTDRAKVDLVGKRMS